jgi:hypothetical protein
MRKQSDDQTETAADIVTLSDRSGDGTLVNLAQASTEDRLRLPPAPRKSAPSEPTPSGGGVVRRDWAAALDLINEACEAVKMSEQRAKDAELYNLNLVQSHAEQMKRAETRAQAAEGRAEAAERRAAEAEEWLLLFHDTIVAGVKGVLDR